MRILLIASLFAGSAALLAQSSQPKIKEAPIANISAASGKEMFNSYCASCHGLGAKGDGPAAPAMNRRPADLTVLAKKNGGKYPAEKVISTLMQYNTLGHGSKDMPVWGPLLFSVSHDDPGVVELRAKNIASYIETLQVK
jgi:mono/diheme cytochrome c family protein